MARCPRCGADVATRFCPDCGMEAPVTHYGQYPPYPYGAPPAAERLQPVWQGIVALVVSSLFGLVAGLILVAAEPHELEELRVGVYAILGIGMLVMLPFAIWALVTNRGAGKTLAGIGLGFWAIMLVTSILR